jgi:cytochrome P450
MSVADDLMREWQGAGPDVVPGRLLALFFRDGLPSREGEGPPLTQPQFSGVYWLLENAALEPDVVQPLSCFEALTRDMRPDGPVPIAIVNYRVMVPTERAVRSVLAAAEHGRPVRFTRDMLDERRVFAATGFLHDQWKRPIPVHRGRDVEFFLDRRFYRTNPDEPWPDRVEVSLDGGDWQELDFGEPLRPVRAASEEVRVRIRCRYGETERTAHFAVAVSDEPAPPEPAETWELEPTDTTARGHASVFRAPEHDEIVNPVIMVEGFPGNRPYDYTYEVLDQHGMVDELNANGYDLVIVGLDDGMRPVGDNVGVLVECMKKARERTSQPLVVGGLSMGGIISRLALAGLEDAGKPHGTRAYLSIDAPHRGTYTSLGVQWFVDSLVSWAPALRGFKGLLDSKANQQLLLWWLDEGEATVSELRGKLVEELDRLGHARQPRKLGVACGRGDGAVHPQTAEVLTWSGGGMEMRIRPLPGDANRVLAEGSWLDHTFRPLGPPPGERALDAAPGGQNTYNGQAGAFARNLACGEVKQEHDAACGVPTVSALDLDQHPLDPVQQDGGPFDACTWNAENRQHLELTKDVTEWIVRELGPPGSEAAKGTRAWNPYAFDPYAPAFLDDPYATYARFRERQPHFYVPQFRSTWFFEYDACNEILGDRTLFLTNHPDGGDPTPGPYGILREFPTTVFSSDPPRHTDLRDVFEPVFRGQIARAEANASERAKAVLAQVEARRHMEFVVDYGVPVPAGVLFDVLGIPEKQLVREGLLLWAGTIIAGNDKRQARSARVAAGTAKMALQTYLQGLLRYYRHEPPKGLIGAMAGAARGPLSVDDVYATCIEFVVAGYLSTTWLVASAILELIKHGQLQAVRDDPAKAPAAIMESLRLEPPVQIIDRFVASHTNVCGVPVRRGDKVTAVIASGNRDDARFGDPDAFRLDRPNADEHLSFGYGIHHCIGAPLAERVAPVMLTELLAFGEPRVDGIPQWQSDPYLRGVVNLPLRF